MDIKEAQELVKRLETERHWDRVLPAHTIAHMAEELGEISRHVLALDHYKKPVKDDKDTLGTELADMFFLLCKLANHQGIDLEPNIKKKLDYCFKTYTPDKEHQVMVKHIAAVKRMADDLDRQR